MNKSKFLSGCFSQISRKVKNLSEHEADKIFNGQFEWKFPEETVSLPANKIVPNDEVITIATQLNSMTSTEEGMKFLKKHCKLKKELQILAKYLDIPFTTGDTVNKLREKIIESTIAYRIRAATIKGQ